MTTGSPSTTTPAAASAISGHLDTRTAAMEVSETLDAQLPGGADLTILFASYHHRAAFTDAAETVRSTLNPRVMLGVTAETVLGGDEERDGQAGISALAMSLPGVNLFPFVSTPADPIRISKPDTIPERIGLDDNHRVTLLLADPFTTPIVRLLPALSTCGGDDPVYIAGGMASGASQPGHNRLLCNDQVRSEGAVGVTISGGVDVDVVVSQGCRPIGEPHVVTKAEKNVILELGGRKALEVLQELAESLTPEERPLLQKGLLIGTVINEYKDHFGRGDFLVKNILGFANDHGGIAVGEVGMVGKTIQFHVRDAQTASEDLHQLLDAQQLKSDPFGALLFTCNGRGTRLFEQPNHDLGVIHERLNNVPTAGFFCAGEIGPIGKQSFLHGHTASLVLFRPR